MSVYSAFVFLDQAIFIVTEWHYIFFPANYLPELFYNIIFTPRFLKRHHRIADTRYSPASSTERFPVEKKEKLSRIGINANRIQWKEMISTAMQRERCPCKTRSP